MTIAIIRIRLVLHFCFLIALMLMSSIWTYCTGFFSQQHLLSLMILLLISSVSSLEEPLWLSYLKENLGGFYRGICSHHHLCIYGEHNFDLLIKMQQLRYFFFSWGVACHWIRTTCWCLYSSYCIINVCNGLSKLWEILIRFIIYRN